MSIFGELQKVLEIYNNTVPLGNPPGSSGGNVLIAWAAFSRIQELAPMAQCIDSSKTLAMLHAYLDHSELSQIPSLWCFKR